MKIVNKGLAIALVVALCSSAELGAPRTLITTYNGKPIAWWSGNVNDYTDEKPYCIGTLTGFNPHRPMVTRYDAKERTWRIEANAIAEEDPAEEAKIRAWDDAVADARAEGVTVFCTGTRTLTTEEIRAVIVAKKAAGAKAAAAQPTPTPAPATAAEIDDLRARATACGLQHLRSIHDVAQFQSLVERQEAEVLAQAQKLELISSAPAGDVNYAQLCRQIATKRKRMSDAASFGCEENEVDARWAELEPRAKALSLSINRSYQTPDGVLSDIQRHEVGWTQTAQSYGIQVETGTIDFQALREQIESKKALIRQAEELGLTVEPTTAATTIQQQIAATKAIFTDAREKLAAFAEAQQQVLAARAEYLAAIAEAREQLAAAHGPAVTVYAGASTASAPSPKKLEAQRQEAITAATARLAEVKATQTAALTAARTQLATTSKAFKAARTKLPKKHPGTSTDRDKFNSTVRSNIGYFDTSNLTDAEQAYWATAIGKIKYLTPEIDRLTREIEDARAAQDGAPADDASAGAAAASPSAAGETIEDKQARLANLREMLELAQDDLAEFAALAETSRENFKKAETGFSKFKAHLKRVITRKKMAVKKRWTTLAQKAAIKDRDAQQAEHDKCAQAIVKHKAELAGLREELATSDAAKPKDDGSSEYATLTGENARIAQQIEELEAEIETATAEQSELAEKLTASQALLETFPKEPVTRKPLSGADALAQNAEKLRAKAAELKKMDNDDMFAFAHKKRRLLTEEAIVLDKLLLEYDERVGMARTAEDVPVVEEPADIQKKRARLLVLDTKILALNEAIIAATSRYAAPTRMAASAALSDADADDDSEDSEKPADKFAQLKAIVGTEIAHLEAKATKYEGEAAAKKKAADAAAAAKKKAADEAAAEAKKKADREAAWTYKQIVGFNLVTIILANVFENMLEGWVGTKVKDANKRTLKQKALDMAKAIISVEMYKANFVELGRTFKPAKPAEGTTTPAFHKRAIAFAKRKPFIAAGATVWAGGNAYMAFTGKIARDMKAKVFGPKAPKA